MQIFLEIAMKNICKIGFDQLLSSKRRMVLMVLLEPFLREKLIIEFKTEVAVGLNLSLDRHFYLSIIGFVQVESIRSQ